ncbi:helix-turn-helix domain-containing protein [[Mycobacterium] burgundiense]|uniref:Helix-turn-helix domain-containing protein n=1 Tax=[Mycobacterium] burgundiense TaxID=3064286 RepID=A0ABM9LHX3_9MYCO|nr:helix-turn-helix domain-containing protein [Mycolicibacterium sp. MU0053]CAJ1499300.1 helix-turn-helix domain-containing protein [Mycolicibacterium sp. MU0053]
MTSAISWSAQPGRLNAQHLAEVLGRYVPFSVPDDRRGGVVGEFTSIVPLEDIVYTDVSWSDRELNRRARSEVPSNGEYFALAAIRSGSELVGIAGDTHRLTAGDVVLWDCQAPTLVSVPSTLRKSSLLIPSQLLQHMSLTPRHRAGLTYLTDAPTAPMLRQLLTYLSDHPQPQSSVYRRTRNALLELALGTIESARDTESTSLLPTLRAAVCRWVDDHLHEPDLRPDTIAAAHAVSVRTLHRAFQSEPQSLGELIAIRKLERARDLLSDGRTVAVVSAMLNFASPSHFSRVFTRRYQVTPSEYKRSCRNDGAGDLAESVV